MNKYNFANDKFSEAQFFLRLMDKNIEDIQHFRYYLSAFLSAARSVLLVWTHESKKNVEFWTWFDCVFEKEPLIEFLKDARDDNTHEGKLTLARGDLYAIELIEIKDNRHIPRSSIRVQIMAPEEIDKFVKDNHPDAQVMKLPKYRWNFANIPSEYSSNTEVNFVSERILDRLGYFLIEIQDRFPDMC